MQVKCEILKLNFKTAFKTTRLEYQRGKWNFKCSGEMRRYLKEHQRRRQLTGGLLTLKYESVGSERD